MSISKKIKIAKAIYEETFTDKNIVDNIVAVLTEIMEGKHPNHESIGILYNVGDLRNIRGFYTSNWIIDDLIQCYQGRALHYCCKQVGLDPTKFFVMLEQIMPFIASTNEQQMRLVPIMMEACLKKFGKPEVVDQDKIDAIRRRYPPDYGDSPGKGAIH